jgi:hypothetical protein
MYEKGSMVSSFIGGNFISGEFMWQQKGMQQKRKN